MARLIDKDALISAMEEFEKALGEDMTHGIFYANIAPTVDAVPVVRCEQCTWWYMGECMFWAGDGMNTEYYDYCSRGKRKEK